MFLSQQFMLEDDGISLMFSVVVSKSERMQIYRYICY